MSLRLYNTLSRQVEEFAPLQPGRVSLYTCGPTVYNYAHIGNFRTFLFEDLLRRWLEASGYDVYQIMNLTDVDDRTINAAREKQVSLREHVQEFIEAFHEDRRYLRIRDASVYPRATDYIGPMVALVEGLLKKGVAYKGEDGSVYFSIGSFPQYGRLSRIDTRELKTGASARVSSDEYSKEDARDFALWKAAKPEDEGDPGAIRLLMFQTHYRQKLDLTDEGLAASQEASRRLGEFQNRLRGALAESDSPRFTNAAQRLRQD